MRRDALRHVLLVRSPPSLIWQVLLELLVETMHARLGRPLHRTLSLDVRRRMLTAERVRKFVQACGRERN